MPYDLYVCEKFSFSCQQEGLSFQTVRERPCDMINNERFVKQNTAGVTFSTSLMCCT